MSLVYRPRAGFGLAFGLGLSVAVHGGLVAAALSVAPPPPPDDAGLKGRELIELAEVEMILAAPETDLADGAPADDSQAVMDSPEQAKLAQASGAPLLAQIPYQVDDPELQFKLANPDQQVQTEDEADEVPTEVQEESRQETAPESVAAAPEASAGQDQASQSAEPEQGLSDEEMAQISDWQKALVLTLAQAKSYPKAARTRRAEGEVLLRVKLDRYGRVLKRSVATGSGWPVLDEAALRVIDSFDRLPAPPAAMGAGPFDLSVPFSYSFK